jgi:hypothetical protein
MKTSRYFDEQVLRKRPEITRELVETALGAPLERRQQPDGRWRVWAFVPQAGKYLRIVLLEDAETVLNAFFDRNYRGKP